MTFLLACLLVGPPSFAAGWFANTLWRQSVVREHMVQKAKGQFSDHVFLGLFALMVGAIIGNILYTNISVGASEERRNVRDREQLVCLSKAFEDFLTGNEKLREASADRDDALVGSKRALRELIRLRVLEQISDSDAVRQAADQYMTQTQRFIEASQALTDARREHPLPRFEERCGPVPN